MFARFLSCSRSRRPGSIAAATGGRWCCVTCGLFPVTSTGLHCGLTIDSPAAWSAFAVPGHVDRAPLRPESTARDRLHESALFPVTSTGLHCGMSNRPVLTHQPYCSRSRRPGSIAAGRAGRAPAPVPPLFPVTSTGLHCGTPGWCRMTPATPPVPGHVDRAPLRPIGTPRPPRSPALFPVTSTGLHCGGGQLDPRRDPSVLFPVTSTGLHCGTSAMGMMCPSGVLFPVTSTGLHCGSCGGFYDSTAGTAVPGHVDRAPLRPRMAPRDAYRVEPLFPVTSTGLHCG